MKHTDGLEAVTVYDSGRVHLIVRVLCLAIGLLCLAISVDLVARPVFGFEILGTLQPMAAWQRALALPAVLALCWFMFVVWFGRRTILWIPSRRELVVKYMHLFWKTSQRLPRDAISFVAVRQGSALGSTSWNIYAVDPAGKRQWLTQVNEKGKAAAVARAIAEAVGVEVRAI